MNREGSIENIRLAMDEGLVPHTLSGVWDF